MKSSFASVVCRLLIGLMIWTPYQMAQAGMIGTELARISAPPDEIVQLREIEYMLGKLLPAEDLDGFEYRPGRIIPFAGRPVTKVKRSVFGGKVSGSRRGSRRI